MRGKGNDRGAGMSGSGGGMADPARAPVVLDDERRRRATEAAHRAWEHVISPRQLGAIGRLLTRGETADVELLLAGLEHEAIERLEAARRPGGDAARKRDDLRIAAQRVFELLRVLPLPAEGDAELEFHVLRVVSLALVAELHGDLALWLRHAEAAARIAALDATRWDAELRRETTLAWLELLDPHGADGLEHAFERIGRLREARFAREPELLSGLALADAQQMRLELAGLYGLAGAAATLVAHLRRAPRAETLRELERHFETVRGVSFGRGALDPALPWIEEAAIVIARRHGSQLPLPGLMA